MRVAVIIVGYNGPEQVADCLRAVAAGSYRDVMAVVVENGSAASHAALCGMIEARSFGGLTVRTVHAGDNPGYAGGINIGTAAARDDADAFWILNPDTEPQPDALSALVTAMTTRDLDVVGGRLIGRDGVVQSDGGRWIPWMARAESLNKGRTGDAAIDVAAIERATGFASGASFLIRGSALERAGGLRADYFLYAEEVEWCVRARQMGLRFGYAPGSIVIHDQGSSTGSAESAATRPKLPIYMDERNKLNVVRDTTPALLPVAVPVALALLVARYGKARAWPQLGHALHGWWHGVLGRRGKPAWLR